MCICNYRYLMAIEEDKRKGVPPGPVERAFNWVLAKLRQRMAG